MEDLGSVNGLVAQDGAQRPARIVVRPGAIVRVGRTTLRFRDPDEPVATALVDVTEPTQDALMASRWLASKWGRLGMPAAAIGTIAGYTWLHSFERSSGSEAFAGAITFLLIGALWAGIWAAASRIVVHRFHFLEHWAVASAAALVSLAFVVSSDWAAFLFPDKAVSSPVEGFTFLAMIAAVVAGHLALASTMTRRRRWRAGIITSGIFLALAGVAALANNESFSDVPEFSGVLKPFRAQWVPAGSVETLGRAATTLKAQVDAIVAEM